MSTSSEYDFAGHDDRIRQHYDHAREKHPYFCDNMDSAEGLPNAVLLKEMEHRLAHYRLDLDMSRKHGNVSWGELLECKMLEAYVEIIRGDTAQAVEELYDCAVVCLRAIDVLEGRQKLGKPKEMLPPCACGGEAATVERGTEPEGFAIMCSRCFRKTALHPSLALAEEEWRTMLTNNTTTKEMKGDAK